jgi:hypothetical protein
VLYCPQAGPAASRRITREEEIEMPKSNEANLTEDRLFSLGCGLIFRAVCAPKGWPPEKVAAEVTRANPPGTSLNEWVISTPDDEREDDFKGVNQLPCPDCPDRIHWLLNC